MTLRRSAGSSDATLALASYCEPAFRREAHDCALGSRDRYIYIRPKKNEQRSKDAAAKKTPNTSGVGKINNYYEDIYIPPYNNTD